jgi:hypothetical protein
MIGSGWLVDTIIVAVRAGVNKDGDVTFADPVQMSARVEDNHELFVDADGNERRANHKVVTLDEVPPGSHVWLSPALYPSEQPETPLKRKHARNKSGMHGHHETLF